MAKKLGLRSKNGFVLIELAIAILIIGILASVASISVMKSQRVSRDTQRKSDMANIEKTLESYYAQNKKYPPSSAVVNTIQGISAWKLDNTTRSTTTPVWINGTDNLSGLIGYTDNLPNDPKGNRGTTPTGNGPIFADIDRSSEHYYSYYSKSCAEIAGDTPTSFEDAQCPYNRIGSDPQSYTASQYYVLSTTLENTSDSETTRNSNPYYLNCAKMGDNPAYNQNAFVKIRVIK